MKRGRPFKPGNKLGRGRPPGSRNKRTLTVQQKLDENSPAILDKMIALALQGNVPILRAPAGHIMTRSSEMPSKTGPLPMGTIDGIAQTTEATLKRVSAGKTTPDQAEQILKWAEARRKIIETQELAKRVNAVEQSLTLEQSRTLKHAPGDNGSRNP